MHVKTLATAMVALIVLVLGGVASAWGQTERPAPVVGVVNIQKIMREATSAKSIREQGEKLRASYTAEVSKRQEELRKVDEELSQQQAILSPEAFQERQREFQTQLEGVQREFQERKRKLDAAFGSAMKEVQLSFVKAVADVSESEGINLVIPREQAVLVNESFDITDKVLKKLDESLPTVEVTLPEE